MNTKISVIIPVKNESAQITKTLTTLLHFRHAGHEIILIDGDSTDNTCDLAWPFCDNILHTKPGRAVQMNKGAEAAKGDILLFLHADTRLPRQALQQITEIAKKRTQQPFWGRFDVRLTGNQRIFRIIEKLMNLRSRLTGIATGDQAIFVSTSLFKQVNGFVEIPLMEDIALSKALKYICSPICIREPLLTSSRRWEKNGILKTIILMWGLRLAYFLGVSPHKLKTFYH